MLKLVHHFVWQFVAFCVSLQTHLLKILKSLTSNAVTVDAKLFWYCEADWCDLFVSSPDHAIQGQQVTL